MNKFKGSEHSQSRRRLLRAGALALAGMTVSGQVGAANTDLCRGDMAIDAMTALLFSAQAPLVPTVGLRDARAVWTRVPDRPDPSVLLFLHGFDNYVTIDAQGRSRVPDWAAGDAKARAGASAKPAAPLVYGLDRLDTKHAGRKPIVLAPENGVLATGSFWSRVPAGQYSDPTRLGRLVSDCLSHLSCLRRPDGHPYLSSRADIAHLRRVYLCGHSGAGLILQEAAGSALLQPNTGVPSDLWLFDCTYWSQIAGFVQFCARWHAAGRLAADNPHASRFVCVYRAKTQTEAIADALRGELAQVLDVPPASLVKDHTPENFEPVIRPALKIAPVLFLRTFLPHDDIPTVFIPALLGTAALS